MNIKNYYPKNSKFALLKISNSSLYFVEESDDLNYLTQKQRNYIVDTSLYIIDSNGVFQHKLTLNQSLDLQALNLITC